MGTPFHPKDPNDHQALTTLLTTKGVGRAGLRVARWSARLISYNYDVTYRPGVENAPADCMSRLPLPDVSSADDSPAAAAKAEDDTEYIALLTAAHESISAADLSSASASSPELTKLCDIISKGWLPSSKGLHPDLLPYYPVRHELSVKDNFVFRGFRLLVPDTLRPALISIAHESHQGVLRTKQHLRELYWWPKIDRYSMLSVHVTCASQMTKAGPATACTTPRGALAKACYGHSWPVRNCRSRLPIRHHND